MPRKDKIHKKPKKARCGDKAPKAIKGLVNARLLALEFEDTFFVPSDASIKAIKTGNFVKVALNNERIWVRVDGYVGRKWFGTVSNDLMLQNDLKCGDCIYFMRKNIYDIYRGKPLS